MIIGIEGGIGQGKTLAMTYFALQEYRELQKRLVCNYHLKDIPFRYVSFQEFLTEALSEQDYRDTAICLDEAHVWVDSRTSQKKTNLLFTYLMLQTGKADVNLYYTTQDFGQVDKRLRQRTDIAIQVTRRGDRHKLKIEDYTCDIRKTVLLNGADIWPFYDTREVVKMPMLDKDREKLAR
jgi:hypothetical protein